MPLVLQGSETRHCGLRWYRLCVHPAPRGDPKVYPPTLVGCTVLSGRTVVRLPTDILWCRRSRNRQRALHSECARSFCATSVSVGFGLREESGVSGGRQDAIVRRITLALRVLWRRSASALDRWQRWTHRRRILVSGTAVFSLALTGLVAVPALAAVDPCVAPVSVIACENSKTGTPADVWEVWGAGDDTIQGFATDMSVNAGETIGFKVKTPAAAYTIDIYRRDAKPARPAQRLPIPHPLSFRHRDLRHPRARPRRSRTRPSGGLPPLPEQSTRYDTRRMTWHPMPMQP